MWHPKSVAFVNPPAPFLSIPNASPPLGLLYLAAVARQLLPAAHIAFIDLADMSALDQNLPMGFDLYCLTATTPQYYWARDLAHSLRRSTPRCRIALGGPHATSCPDDVVLDGFDYVVTGEADCAIAGLLSDAVPPGVVRCIRPERLDDLPFPAVDLLAPSQYRYSFECRSIVQLTTTRGCPYACWFCAIPRLHGGAFRARSVQNVAEELRLLKARDGVAGVYFVDANFTHNRERTLALCDVLQSLGLEWVCQTRADLVDEELLAAMAKAGCKRISFGVESATETSLAGLGKSVTVSDNARALMLARQCGIRTRVYLMFGGPADNRETAQALKDFIASTRPDQWHFSTFIPYPGTPFWTSPSDYGLDIVDRDFRHYYHLGVRARGAIVAANRHCSKEELEQIRDDLFHFFLRTIPDPRVLYGLGRAG